MGSSNVFTFSGQTILVTGAAGFIGYHLVRRMIESSDASVTVVGFDNMNGYYDVNLKEERLRRLQECAADEKKAEFVFVRGSLCDKQCVESIFDTYQPAIVVNLAAQVGVRYSIDHPGDYIESNIIGFYHILEACRRSAAGVQHLVYASSSSVYGSSKKVPYAVTDQVDTPVSLYAATKKSDELMAHVYSRLYGIPTTGLRFFTVYGPFGRPDMAYFKFTNQLVRGEKIQIYNYGDMYRDFTYVDDIVKGVAGVMHRQPPVNEDGVRYKIYNIGNSQPESLLHFVEVLENCLIKEGLISGPGEKELLPMQPGDVYQTYADVSELERDFGFRPSTGLEQGLAAYVKWYQEYYGA